MKLRRQIESQNNSWRETRHFSRHRNERLLVSKKKERKRESDEATGLINSRHGIDASVSLPFFPLWFTWFFDSFIFIKTNSISCNLDLLDECSSSLLFLPLDVLAPFIVKVSLAKKSFFSSLSLCLLFSTSLLSVIQFSVSIKSSKRCLFNLFFLLPLSCHSVIRWIQWVGKKDEDDGESEEQDEGKKITFTLTGSQTCEFLPLKNSSLRGDFTFNTWLN